MLRGRIPKGVPVAREAKATAITIQERRKGRGSKRRTRKRGQDVVTKAVQGQARVVFGSPRR